MIPLTYFVCGIVFIVFVLPVLQSLTDAVMTVSEVFKSKMSVVITKNNCEMDKLSVVANPVSTQAIGFKSPEISSDIEYDGEEEFEDLSMYKIQFRGGN